VHLAFDGEIWFWKGPAPWHFVTVPDPQAAELEAASAYVTYGWGMVPARVTIGATTWETSLWPKDGGYVVPLKAAVRRAERLEVGDPVTVELTLDL
jgi:hypothetical protein